MILCIPAEASSRARDQSSEDTVGPSLHNSLPPRAKNEAALHFQGNLLHRVLTMGRKYFTLRAGTPSGLDWGVKGHGSIKLMARPGIHMQAAPRATAVCCPPQSWSGALHQPGRCPVHVGGGGSVLTHLGYHCGKHCIQCFLPCGCCGKIEQTAVSRPTSPDQEMILLPTSPARQGYQRSPSEAPTEAAPNCPPRHQNLLREKDRSRLFSFTACLGRACLTTLRSSSSQRLSLADGERKAGPLRLQDEPG